MKLRDAVIDLLKVLPIKEARLMGTRGWAFLVVAPLLWSVLPLEAHLASSLLSFRKHIKIELFRRTCNGLVLLLIYF